MDKDFILIRIKQNRAKIEEKGVASIALFGSYSIDKQTENSDIDLIIEFHKEFKNFDNFMDIVFFLEDLLGKRIELLTPESVSPEFLSSISNDLIYAY